MQDLTPKRIQTFDDLALEEDCPGALRGRMVAAHVRRRSRPGRLLAHLAPRRPRFIQSRLHPEPSLRMRRAAGEVQSYSFASSEVDACRHVPQSPPIAVSQPQATPSPI